LYIQDDLNITYTSQKMSEVLLTKEQFYEKQSEKIKKENPKKKFTGQEMAKKLEGAWRTYQEESKKAVKQAVKKEKDAKKTKK